MSKKNEMPEFKEISKIFNNFCEETNDLVSGKKIVKKEESLKETCECISCDNGNIHMSDCAVHNEPMKKAGDCNCHLSK